MQMFVLADIPDIAARALADCHTRVIGREVTMCLSAWYAKNMGHKDALPYKEFNHPIAEQFSDPRTRLWAMHYATAIFMDFKNRFGKVHASEEKLDQLRRYCVLYDLAVHKIGLHQMWHARFTYVGIDDMPIPGRTIIRDLSMDEAVALYRQYYKVKLPTMKVPATWTNATKPEWLED